MIIVEDGSIVANANSYISVANFEIYAADRGITITGDSEELLIQAMDYLESLEYKGLRYSRDQSLKFPRGGIIYDGFEYLANTIPPILIKAQCEAALAIDAGNGPLADIAPGVKRQKVGELEVEYQDNASSVTNTRKITAAIYPLLASGGGQSWNFGVSKA